MNSWKSIILVALVLGLVSCQKKKDEITADPAAPIFPSNIHFSNKTSTGLTLTWEAATDDMTPSSEIKYKVTYSTANSLDTTEKAEAATVLMEWTANTFTTSLSSLTHSTTYYFAVMAKDSDDKVTLLSDATATLCSGKIIFLASTSNANVGGISGADSICNSNKPNGFSSSFKAMMAQGNTRAACYSGGGNNDCTSSSTGRVDWVFTANQSLCTSDYATQIGTTNSLALLKVTKTHTLGTSDTFTYTGFNTAWGSSANNCSNWTAGTNLTTGITGNGSSITGNNDFHAGGFVGCGSTGTIYCVEQ